jgi:hypothetical protein
MSRNEGWQAQTLELHARRRAADCARVALAGAGVALAALAFLVLLRLVDAIAP